MRRLLAALLILIPSVASAGSTVTVTGTLPPSVAYPQLLGSVCINSGVSSLASGAAMVLPCNSSGQLVTSGSGGGGSATAANQTSVQTTIAPGTAPTNANVAGGVYNSTAPTLTNGQTAAQQLDANGNLKVNVAAGGTVAQASTTSGQGVSLIAAATSTTPPSETTGQTNPVSLDLNGGVRIAPTCNKVINIAQTATTDVHTFTGYGYICSIVLVSATAQNIGIDEGTGTTCETGGTALIGVSSTASATAQMAVAASGGFSAVSGPPWLRTQTSADHLCVVQSSTGEVAGTITYADLTN